MNPLAKKRADKKAKRRAVKREHGNTCWAQREHRMRKIRERHPSWTHSSKD